MVSAATQTNPDAFDPDALTRAFESYTGGELQLTEIEELCKNTNDLYGKIVASAEKTEKTKTAYVCIGDKWSQKRALLNSLKPEGWFFCDPLGILPFLTGYSSDVKIMSPKDVYEKWKELSSIIARVVEFRLMQEGYSLFMRWPHWETRKSWLFERLELEGYRIIVLSVTRDPTLTRESKTITLPVTNSEITKTFNGYLEGDLELPEIVKKQKERFERIQFYHYTGSLLPSLASIWRAPGQLDVIKPDLHKQIAQRYEELSKEASIPFDFGSVIGQALPIEGPSSN
jgi:hypothetical protein